MFNAHRYILYYFSCLQDFVIAYFIQFYFGVLFYRTRVRLVYALRTLRAFQTSSSACVRQVSLEKFVLSVSMKKQQLGRS